jgi:hypothetical protein
MKKTFKAGNLETSDIRATRQSSSKFGHLSKFADATSDYM